MLSRRLCRTLRILVCLAVHAVDSGGFAAAEESVVVAPRGTPLVDGELDGIWDAAAPASVSHFLVAEEEASTTAARVRLLWDDDHLYLLWHVRDAEPGSAHPDAWQRDSVEWFVDENRKKTSTYENDDAQYRSGADGFKSGGKNYHPDNLKVVAKKLEHGYRVEASMRWRTIQGKAGAELGIEFQVNDDAGAGYRQAVVKWADDSDDSWFDTSGFGVLRLEEASDHRSSAAKDLVPTAADQVSGQRVGKSGQLPIVTVPESTHSFRQRIPQWAADAIFYQVFPERFCNGDPSNDPTRESLEFVDIVPTSWQVSDWTSDWYSRAAWEREMGDDFYEDGVFHRRYGGDLQGVLDKLDYLKELGINTIYFNPVFYARSLHKYDGNSYHHVDPHFGPDPEGDLRLMRSETSDPASWVWTASDKMFLRVVQEAHQRGIRVVIDGVFNHTGRDFFAFEDLRRRQQASPYVDWYTVEAFDDPRTAENEFKYACWWGVDTLPEFADTADHADLHPGPKQYIFDATARWMDPNRDGDPSDGIDGWRLDVANDVPDQFWRDWHAHIRAVNPEAYTVAEIWNDASDYLRRCGFSATMNYHGFAFLVKGFLIDGRVSAAEFSHSLQERASEYAWEAQLALQNLVDSHDTDRLASMIVNASKKAYRQPERFDYDVTEVVSPRHGEYSVRKPNTDERTIQRLVVLFQMTSVGAPMVYYGSEAGMWGADDPDDRKPMVWPEVSYEGEATGPTGQPRAPDRVDYDDQLAAFYRGAIQFRAQHPSLRRGKFKVLATEGQTLVFSREYEDEIAIVAINRGISPHRSTIRLGAGRMKSVGSRFSTDDGVHVVAEEGGFQLDVPPLAGEVFVVKRE